MKKTITIDKKPIKKLTKEKMKEYTERRRSVAPWENSFISINSQRKKKGQTPIKKSEYLQYYYFVEAFRNKNNKRTFKMSIDLFLKLLKKKRIIIK